MSGGHHAHALPGLVGLFVVWLLAFASPAGATITTTSVTSPSDPTFVNPQTNPDDGAMLSISGTTNSDNTGSDKVDIHCVYDNGQTEVGGVLAANVPLDGSGNFSTTITEAKLTYYVCRVVALPAGGSAPVNLADFSGPVVGFGQREYYTVSGKPDGALEDFYQAASPASGYSDGYSISDCFLDSTYLSDPISLDYRGALFECSQVRNAPDPPGGNISDAGLKVDGHLSFLPAEATFLPLTEPGQRPGFEPIEGLTRSYNTSNGTLTVDDTEPAVRCTTDTQPIEDTNCPDFLPADLRVDEHRAVEQDGRLILFEHNWVNTGSGTRQVDMYYEVRMTPTLTPGYEFPGQGAFSARSEGDASGGAFPVPPAGPGTVRVVADSSGTPCAFNDNDMCGSLTWSKAPNDIVFTNEDDFWLHYVFSVPQNGCVPIALAYTQSDSQAQENALISQAESETGAASCPASGGGGGGGPTPTPLSNRFTLKLKKLKPGAKRVSFIVDLPGAGLLDARLTAQGVPGRAAPSRSVTLGSTHLNVTAAGRRTMTVKLNVSAGKLLRKSRRLRAKLTVTYTPTGGTSASQSAGVKLRAR